MLMAVWTISLFLGLASIAIMLVLIGVRVVHERRRSADMDFRKRLLSALIRFSEDDDAGALKAVVERTPPAVVTDASSEFLSLLRGDERQRIEAVLAGAGLPAFLRRQLLKANEAQRIHAAEMLTAFPEPATLDSLKAALGDRSREVRITAAIALAELETLPPLADLLGRIGSGGQRSRRLIELFQSFPPERNDELRAYAAKPGNPPFVRAAAIDALSLAGNLRLLPFFEACAGDPALEVAAAAIRAIGRNAHPGSAPTVLAAMGSGNWEVRSEAAEAAGRIGIEQAVEPLCGLLEDPEWAVRYAAGKSLRDMGERGAAALKAIAEAGTARSQRTASLVLEEGLAA